MAHMYVVIAVVNFMGYASRSPFIAVINGIGHAKLSFVIGVIDSFVARLGIAILLGYVFNMGIMGFWLGGVLGGYAYTVIGGAYYFSGKWKTRPLAVA
jgi:Na+-driven multidrug efflux pump